MLWVKVVGGVFFSLNLSYIVIRKMRCRSKMVNPSKKKNIAVPYLCIVVPCFASMFGLLEGWNQTSPFCMFHVIYSLIKKWNERKRLHINPCSSSSACPWRFRDAFCFLQITSTRLFFSNLHQNMFWKSEFGHVSIYFGQWGYILNPLQCRRTSQKLGTRFWNLGLSSGNS